MSHRATVIACVNQKGGTGKTTTCENLGIGLAADGKEAICYGRFAIEKDAGSRRKEEGIATRL